MKIQFREKTFEVNQKTKISDLLKDEIENSEHPVIAAIFNNEYVNLDYEVEEDGTIKLVDISEKQGMKIYRRTLIYILSKAIRNLDLDYNIIVDHQLYNATFCEVEGKEILEDDLKKINEEMRRIIKKDIPIKKVVMTRDEAKKFYEETGTSKGFLQYALEENKEIKMYFCEDYFNYCYGELANKTGITRIFEIMKYKDGILMRYPDSSKPEQMSKLIQYKKIEWALDEYDDIHKILNMNSVYKLNKAVEEDRIKDVIMLDEALHEKKIANIADKIAKNRNIKMVLIAGPSSSGKTTFAKRLGIQLRINRIKPVTISVDNYFVERKDTPKDENGNYDFECIEAIDLDLFNDHLTKLLNGEEVEMPEFDFYEGTKKYKGKKLKLEKDEILVIEGIHCLNDKLTSRIPKEQKFKIYISALTVLNMDRYTRISSGDTRIIRRIVRDYQFRGYAAKHTIGNWWMVNRGEVKNIFPFQEEADIIFNTSLIYELGVLKGMAIPMLEEITKEDEEYAEARRLLNLLKYIRTIPKEYVPSNSLLKEFVGGGDFKY